jgi:hypothetical protein
MERIYHNPVIDQESSDLGQCILVTLRQRASVKQLRSGEYRTRCLRPEKHKHGDAHPSMDFNPEKGAICRVCGFKAGLVTMARDLGIDRMTGTKQRRFETEAEAMRALREARKLHPETLDHFGIKADIKRQSPEHNYTRALPFEFALTTAANKRRSSHE